MKNTIKKSDMCGQFIDMQPTRGGIPSKIVQTALHVKDLERAKIPYVIGRIGWTKCRKPTPIDRIYVHYTDLKRAEAYYNVLWKTKQKYTNFKDEILRNIFTYNLPLPEEHRKILIENFL